MTNESASASKMSRQFSSEIHVQMVSLGSDFVFVTDYNPPFLNIINPPSPPFCHKTVRLD